MSRRGVLRKRLPLQPAATISSTTGTQKGALSLRALDRIARVSWTIADLADLDRPDLDEVTEAMDLRNRNAEEAT